jgi:hypothetical protein
MVIKNVGFRVVRDMLLLIKSKGLEENVSGRVR